MSPDLLKALAEQTVGRPRGVAARIDAADLKTLLEEREDLLSSLLQLRGEAVHLLETGLGKPFLKGAIERAEEEILEASK